MNLAQLENLVRINNLQREAPDAREISGLIERGRKMLQDSENTDISEESRFSLVYIAAHSFSLAALRHHGYRSDSRYLVFQCLQHTLGLENAKWTVLDRCHRIRNAAEYEGAIDIPPNLLNELISITSEISLAVEGLNC